MFQEALVPFFLSYARMTTFIPCSFAFLIVGSRVDPIGSILRSLMLSVWMWILCVWVWTFVTTFSLFSCYMHTISCYIHLCMPKISLKNSKKIPIIFLVYFDQFWYIACQDWSRNTRKLFCLGLMLFLLLFVEKSWWKACKIWWVLFAFVLIDLGLFLVNFVWWKLLEKIHGEIVWILCRFVQFCEVFFCMF